MSIQDEIERTVLDLFSNEERIPDEIRELISLANQDLYFGPVYLSPEGELACFGDEDVRPFAFSKATAKIAEWLDEQPDLYYEVWSGYLSERSPEGEDEYYLIDRAELAKIICGKELAGYV